MNLNNLYQLQHNMSINDLYDALEALDVAQSWAEATILNQKEDTKE